MTPRAIDPDRLVISSCSLHRDSLETVLSAFAGIGFCRFELFTEWAASRVDIQSDPNALLDLGARHGMTFAALHLPRIVPGDRYEETLGRALDTVRFAAAVGVRIVLLKASDIATHKRAAGPVLDAAPLGVTVVVQNHADSALERPEQICAVLDGASDSRLRSLLEVGQYHTIGIGWREAAAALGDSIAYVHVKDQIGALSVPFGTGEIDLRGLFTFLEEERGYRGDYVIEMEVVDPKNTVRYCRDARDYVLHSQGTGGTAA